MYTYVYVYMYVYVYVCVKYTKKAKWREQTDPLTLLTQVSPIFCPVLGGNGNRINTRWRPNEKEKEPRSPRS